ncbi:MAG: ATP-dependent DNA ligase [Nitrososphaerota archaeon]|nr:ATP-dependent DNA ligase [Nitrososphaerota archaeon]
MLFQELAEAYEEMTKTSSRTELTTILVGILKKASADEIGKVVYLTQGKLYPDFVGIEIGMAEKTAAQALEMAYGASPKKIEEYLKAIGDLGSVASELSKKKVQQSFFAESLNLDNVFGTLDEIARTSGKGSSSARIGRLVLLLNSASTLEAKFLIRFVTGNLRLGVADFTVLDALAIAYTEDKKNREKLETAYNITSDLGFVGSLLAKEGIRAIEGVKVEAGRPIRPMLAERLSTTAEIIEKMGFDAYAEYKLDGERVQAHKSSNDEITLFSRRIEQITSQYGDVVEALKAIPSKNFILEGEIVAIDSGGRYLPFQELMHRRRKYELEEARRKYPVLTNLFDVMLFNGKSLIDEPYEARRKALESALKSAKSETVRLVPCKRVKTSEEIDAFMEKSLSEGCEGVVIKDVNGKYRAGARGFSWIKFKPEYRPDVRDTIDLVLVGADHGMGRRAGVYGAFLLAAYDRDEDVFKSTTKIGTGFSDVDLENFSNLLEEHKISSKSPRVDSKADAQVWFEPRIVIEVIASEITLSPIYTAGWETVREKSGLALRFPKFTGKIRTDKAPEDATTVEELLELYNRQKKSYAK